jgi:PhnB protein
MTKLNSYLNFQGNSEEAFQFYKSAFGTEFETLMRFKDIPEFPGREKLTESDLNKIMHISLPIGENRLMATDLLESLGQNLKTGNAVTLCLYPESKEEADRLYSLLSLGGKAHSPMSEMFWGYWGMLTDKFGVQWMVNYQKS